MGTAKLPYGGVVRVLGLEPSLFRGKSPVPYQSGVTRMVRQDRVELPVPEGPGVTAPVLPTGALTDVDGLGGPVRYVWSMRFSGSD